MGDFGWIMSFPASYKQIVNFSIHSSRKPSNESSAKSSLFALSDGFPFSHNDASEPNFLVLYLNEIMNEISRN